MRQVYQYVMEDCQLTEARFCVEFPNRMEIRYKDPESGLDTYIEQGEHEDPRKFRNLYNMPAAVFSQMKMKVNRANHLWVNYTAGCGIQEYFRLVLEKDPTSGVIRVLTAVGPRESWYEPNDYEYVVFVGGESTYGQFQHFLRPENCVGLAYNGAYKSGSNLAEWVGVFASSDPRYQNLRDLRWSVEGTWVNDNFSRFVYTAMANPNVMIDLLASVKFDRGYRDDDPNRLGWTLLMEDEGVSGPKFTFWADRPDDLIQLNKGCVKNLFEVMRIPGSRWRFFGRFISLVYALLPIVTLVFFMSDVI